MIRACGILGFQQWRRFGSIGLRRVSGGGVAEPEDKTHGESNLPDHTIEISPTSNIEDKLGDVQQRHTKAQPSTRYLKFKEKLRSEAPLSCLPKGLPHPAHEKEPLKPWPNNTNPYTGEIGGPSGPEPTRYGDWERKGRVSDF